MTKVLRVFFFSEVSQFYLMRRLNLGAHFAYAGYTVVADPFSSTFEKLRIYIVCFILFACAYAFGPPFQFSSAQESTWKGLQCSDLSEALSVAVLRTLILWGIQFFPWWGEKTSGSCLIKGLILHANKQPSYYYHDQVLS